MTNVNVTDVTLYGITQEMMELENALIESGGEITEDQEAIMVRLGEALTVKTDNIVGFVKKQEDTIQAFANRIEELKTAQAKYLRGMEKFNEYVIGCMKAKDVKEIKGVLSSIKMRKPAQIVEILDQEKIPEEFIKVTKKVTTSIDKTKVKAALKNGDDIPGARLAEGKISVKYQDGE